MPLIKASHFYGLMYTLFFLQGLSQKNYILNIKVKLRKYFTINYGIIMMHFGIIDTVVCG